MGIETTLCTNDFNAEFLIRHQFQLMLHWRPQWSINWSGALEQKDISLLMLTDSKALFDILAL